jgi:hypothetical protein
VGDESKDLDAPSHLFGGSAARDDRARARLRPFADLLRNYIGDKVMSTSQASTFLRKQAGYMEAMREQRAPSFPLFLKLFDGFSFLAL